MTIVSRWGGDIVLEREATLKDIRPLDHRKADKQDAERISYGMLWVGYLTTSPSEKRIFDLAFLRADGGWAEIDDERRRLMGEARYQEACNTPVSR